MCKVYTVTQATDPHEYPLFKYCTVEKKHGGEVCIYNVFGQRIHNPLREFVKTAINL